MAKAKAPKKPPLGSGQRFKKLASSFGPSIKNPAALAASIGRAKLGKQKFQQLAAKGKKG